MIQNSVHNELIMLNKRRIRNGLGGNGFYTNFYLIFYLNFCMKYFLDFKKN